MNLGVLFAFGALFGWAVGDFLIQRTVRATSIIKSLFYIGFVGAIGILPFVINDIRTILPDPANWPLLFILAAIVILAALANFQGLKQGKLSVVLPLNGVELPVTIVLSWWLGHERLGWHYYGLMGVVAIGIALTLISSFGHLKKIRLEKGVFYALLGAVGLGATSFVVGFMSQSMTPLFTIWFSHTSAALVCLIILMRQKELKNTVSQIWRHPHIIFWQSFLDNASWIFFAFASTFIPISVATTISECYIAVGAVLGLLINKERLKGHQYLGAAISFLGVILLSAMAS